MVRKPNKKLKMKPFKADHLGDPKAISIYLTEALETRDSSDLVDAISNVVMAKGIGQTARITGLDRSNLYRAFGGGRVPDFKTLSAILKALGLKFAVEPIAQKQKGKAPY